MRSTRLRTTNYLAMLLALCLPACVQAATEAELCARDLEDIAQFMPANDAGASDALARRGAAINDALLKARGEMPQVSDRAGCDASPRLQIMVDRRIAAGAVAHLRHLATRLKQSIVDRRAAPRQSIAGAGVVDRHELGDIFQIARAQFCLCRSLDAGWQAKRQQHGQIIRGSQSRAPHR